ncbi:glycosyltransferase family 2 protein [Tamlana sp. I1]|uniref:glycosyltransferase family 2 protein n=1 Tax=Tamlana sp. I1 TaxID=2762061 RepID=UPI00188F816E|nr:glycosyltransferase [Tamlana sp. I1]
MSTPLVSIIIPTFNRTHLIGETLDSVLAQTYQNWECIVVDDGSTDNTAELLETYCKKDARFQYHHRPADRLPGGNAARNYGFELSKGEYVMFLDSDDFLNRNCLDGRLSVFFKKSNVNAVIADTAKWDPILGIGKSINKDPIEVNQNHYLLLFLSYNLPWHTMSGLWNRHFLTNIFFDEKLKRFQDVDFHIRLLLNNKVVLERLNKIDSYYRNSSDEKKGAIEIYNSKVLESYIEIIKKAKNWNLDSNQKKAFKRFLYVTFKSFVFHGKQQNFLNYKFLISSINSITKLKLTEYSFFYLMALYSFLGLTDKKGIGSYKLSQQADIYFNKLIIMNE